MRSAQCPALGTVHVSKGDVLVMVLLAVMVFSVTLVTVGMAVLVVPVVLTVVLAVVLVEVVGMLPPLILLSEVCAGPGTRDSQSVLAVVMVRW